VVPKGLKQRRLHKAFLRYHDANNWPLLREALERMGRADLIGNGKRHLVPRYQPAGTGGAPEGRRVKGKPGAPTFRTQHARLEGEDLERSSRSGTSSGSRAPLPRNRTSGSGRRRAHSKARRQR
jgi:hypothetical protein